MTQEFNRILVRMPNWVGDLVMATPLLTDLRAAYPSAEICVMCRKGMGALLEHDPDVNEVFSFDQPKFGKRDAKRDIIAQIKRGNYDLGVLTTNSFSSALWFRRGGVKRRIGFKKDCRGLLLTDRVSFPPDVQSRHLVNTYKQLLGPLGMEPSHSPPRLHLHDGELDQARGRLEKLGIGQTKHIVGINPGAAFGSAKCWLPDRFREVTERLIEDPNTYVVYFGDATGAPLVKQICHGLPDRVINLAGATTLRELACMISICDVFLTNDSGPMHIASAVSTPLVALFGSTSAVKTGPYGGGNVIHKHVECSPCYARTCPKGHFNCMKAIHTDEVFDKVVAAINAR